MKVGDVFENNFKTESLNASSCQMTFFFKGQLMQSHTPGNCFLTMETMGTILAELTK